MVDAIKKSTSVDLGNTRVEVFGQTVKVYLFNRLIADIDYTYMLDPVCELDGRLIVSTDKGFMTSVKVSRLNAILGAFGKPKIVTWRYAYCFEDTHFTDNDRTFYGLER